MKHRIWGTDSILAAGGEPTSSQVPRREVRYQLAYTVYAPVSSALTLSKVE